MHSTPKAQGLCCSSALQALVALAILLASAAASSVLDSPHIGQVRRDAAGTVWRVHERASDEDTVTPTFALRRLGTSKALADKCLAVSDPTSQDYGDYLTLAEVTERYGADPKYIDIVKNAVSERYGGTKVRVVGGGAIVRAELRARDAERAFGTQLYRYRSEEREDAPFVVRSHSRHRVPGELATVVEAVFGVHELLHPALSRNPARHEGSYSGKLDHAMGRVMSAIAAGDDDWAPEQADAAVLGAAASEAMDGDVPYSLDAFDTKILFAGVQPAPSLFPDIYSPALPAVLMHQSCPDYASVRSLPPCKHTYSGDHDTWVASYDMHLQLVEGASVRNVTVRLNATSDCKIVSTDTGKHVALAAGMPGSGFTMPQLAQVIIWSVTPVLNHGNVTNPARPSSTRLHLAQGTVAQTGMRAFYGVRNEDVVTPKSREATQGFASFSQFIESKDLQLLSLLLQSSPLRANATELTFDPGIVSVHGPQNDKVAGGEAVLDSSWMYGTAPTLPTTVISLGDEDFILEWAVEMNAYESVPRVVSISYGASESDINSGGGVDYMRMSHDELAKLCIRGITVFVASGDAGATQRGHGEQSCGLHADFPSNSPWITSVSATTLVKPDFKAPGNPTCTSRPHARLGDVCEVAVDYGLGLGWTTGGGFSQTVARPAYQDKAVQQYMDRVGDALPSNAPRNGRAFPDVAAIGESMLVRMNGKLSTESGTSGASPMMAAMFALINAARMDAGHPALGLVNPALYQLHDEDPSYFYDVTVGSNRCGEDVCCPQGYDSGPGYDPVTGLGTIGDFVRLKDHLMKLGEHASELRRKREGKTAKAHAAPAQAAEPADPASAAPVPSTTAESRSGAQMESLVREHMSRAVPPPSLSAEASAVRRDIHGEEWALGARVASEESVPLLVSLRMDASTVQALEQECQNVSDPDSSKYGQYLSLPEVETKYGASAFPMSDLKDALTAAGGKAVAEMGAGAHLLAWLPASSVEALFGCAMHEWRHKASGRSLRRCGGWEHVGMPRWLADRVSTVSGVWDMTPAAPPGREGSFPAADSELAATVELLGEMTGEAGKPGVIPAGQFGSVIAVHPSSLPDVSVKVVLNCTTTAPSPSHSSDDIPPYPPCRGDGGLELEKIVLQFKVTDGEDGHTASHSVTMNASAVQHTPPAQPVLRQQYSYASLRVPYVVPRLGRVEVEKLNVTTKGGANHELAASPWLDGMYATLQASVHPSDVHELYGAKGLGLRTGHGGWAVSQAYASFDGQYVQSSDVEKLMKAASKAPTGLFTKHGPNDRQSPGAKATLAMNWLYGVASNVDTMQWYSWLQSLDALLLWAVEVNNREHVPTVFTVSHTASERSYVNATGSDASMVAVKNEVAKMCVRGVGVYVSAGDGGASDLGLSSKTCQLSPVFPATLPFVTTVSSTALTTPAMTPGCNPRGKESGAFQGMCELPVSVHNGLRWTGGGGFSSVFKRPYHQDKAVSQYLSAGDLPSVFNHSNRAYPDVAAVGTALAVILYGNEHERGSTAGSTALFAALMSQVNKKRVEAGQPQLGFVAPSLYRLFSKVAGAFHNVEGGSNACGRNFCCPEGYSSSGEWDAVTGLGSPGPFNLIVNYLMHRTVELEDVALRGRWLRHALGTRLSLDGVAVSDCTLMDSALHNSTLQLGVLRTTEAGGSAVCDSGGQVVTQRSTLTSSTALSTRLVNVSVVDSRVDRTEVEGSDLLRGTVVRSHLTGSHLESTVLQELVAVHRGWLSRVSNTGSGTELSGCSITSSALTGVTVRGYPPSDDMASLAGQEAKSEVRDGSLHGCTVQYSAVSRVSVRGGSVSDSDVKQGSVAMATVLRGTVEGVAVTGSTLESTSVTGGTVTGGKVSGSKLEDVAVEGCAMDNVQAHGGTVRDSTVSNSVLTDVETHNVTLNHTRVVHTHGGSGGGSPSGTPWGWIITVAVLGVLAIAGGVLFRPLRRYWKASRATRRASIMELAAQHGPSYARME